MGNTPEWPRAALTIGVDEVLAHAAHIGLPLDESEAGALLPGVRRIRQMADEVRALISPDTEPSGPEVAPTPAAR